MLVSTADLYVIYEGKDEYNKTKSLCIQSLNVLNLKRECSEKRGSRKRSGLEGGGIGESVEG